MQNGPEIVVYQVAWKEDAEPEEGERPNSIVNCRVFIDGEEVLPIVAVEYRASSDFSTIKLELVPGKVRFEQVTYAEFRGELKP